MIIISYHDCEGLLFICRRPTSVASYAYAAENRLNNRSAHTLGLNIIIIKPKINKIIILIKFVFLDSKGILYLKIHI